jgi:DNA-binding ferritin-like protein
MQEMSKSRVALSDDTKRKLSTTLNLVLATAIDLRSQAKQAHWNTKGPEFYARHLLFDRHRRAAPSRARHVVPREPPGGVMP